MKPTGQTWELQASAGILKPMDLVYSLFPRASRRDPCFCERKISAGISKVGASISTDQCYALGTHKLSGDRGLARQAASKADCGRCVAALEQCMCSPLCSPAVKSDISHRHWRNFRWRCAGSAATETVFAAFGGDRCQLHDVCGGVCRCASIALLTSNSRSGIDKGTGGCCSMPRDQQTAPM